MAELLRRSAVGLVYRADPGDATQGSIEGIVLPWDQVTRVSDPGINGGRPYRESIARGAAGDLDPSTVLLEYTPTPWDRGKGHDDAVLIGRGTHAENRDDGLFMRFGVSRTSHGNDARELAHDGILTDFSVVMDPLAERKRPDGVVERTAVGIRRVALLERGAYHGGAQVTAVRSATEGNMPASTPAPTPDADVEDQADEATAPATTTGRPNRTRVTVDVERAQAEREAVAGMSRSASRGGAFAPFGSTREESVYGPGSGRSFFGDGWLVSQRGQGWEEANGRLERHSRMLEDIDVAIQRRIGIAGLQRAARILDRAGDVLSSEIGGAYPSEYLPGLLVPRILKDRPMGGFYSRVPLVDGRPRIYPVVTTSTTVAVQGSEGANPAASDFGTTGTTVTPLFYGGETKVSRQVLDGADPSIDAMLQQDLAEAYSQASEAIVRAAVEAGSAASGVTLTAATPNAGLIGMYTNHIGNVFNAPQRLFLPTTLTNSWLTQLDTTGRPVAPYYGAFNADGLADPDGVPIIGRIFQAPVAQSWSSTAGAGAGVGGVAVIGRETDFAVFESTLTSFKYDQGAEAPSAVRIGLWAYLVVGTRRGSRKATGA